MSEISDKSVSIIVPNYNHAKFLKRRFESIFNQTYKNYEVIILDDNSTDESRNLIEAYAKYPKIKRIVLNEVNSGSSFKQWQKGIEIACGEFIWIAESDDWADERFLERIMKKFSEFENLGLVYCQSWKVDKYDNIIGNLKEWTDPIDKEHWSKDYITSGKDELSDYFCLRNTIPNASAVVFKKKLFSPLEDRVQTMRLCGDKMIWSKILLQTDIYFIAEPLNYFRTHEGNVRSNISSIRNLYENFVWVHYIFKKSDISNNHKKIIQDWLMDWWKRSHKGLNSLNFIYSILIFGFRINLKFGLLIFLHLIFSATNVIWNKIR